MDDSLFLKVVTIRGGRDMGFSFILDTHDVRDVTEMVYDR